VSTCDINAIRGIESAGTMQTLRNPKLHRALGAPRAPAGEDLADHSPVSCDVWISFAR